MKLEVSVYPIGDRFSFDILDVSATLENEEALPEHLYDEGKQYARYETAERKGNEWIRRYNKADDAKRRKLCGYDSVTACRRVQRPVPPVRKRVGKSAR